ncbi:MAG: hypothetical protein JRI34_03365 [Deltaproteobacteria bacterium]|nr:hypothetical protein [Deltaproteobacteria bacterium]
MEVVPPFDVMLADGLAEATYWEVLYEPVPVVLVVDGSQRFQPVIKLWSGKVPKAEEVLAVLKQSEEQ